MIEVDISQAPKENIMNEETPQTDIEESSLKTMNYPINRRYRPRSKYYTLIHRLCSMNIFILVFLGSIFFGNTRKNYFLFNYQP